MQNLVPQRAQRPDRLVDGAGYQRLGQALPGGLDLPRGPADLAAQAQPVQQVAHLVLPGRTDAEGTVAQRLLLVAEQVLMQPRQPLAGDIDVFAEDQDGNVAAVRGQTRPDPLADMIIPVPHGIGVQPGEDVFPLRNTRAVGSCSHIIRFRAEMA